MDECYGVRDGGGRVGMVDRRSVLVNVTGRDLRLLVGDEEIWFPGRRGARLDSTMTLAERLTFDDIRWTVPVLAITEQKIIGLPGRRDGVLYVASGLVAAFANSQGREDVVSPGRVIREGGVVKGARALVRIERRKQ